MYAYLKNKAQTIALRKWLFYNELFDKQTKRIFFLL